MVDALDRPDNPCRMPVGGIDHHHIHLFLDQQLHPFFQVSPHSHCCPYQQAPLGILGSIGEITRLLDILNRDQSLYHTFIIDQRQFFDLMLLQQLLGFLQADAHPGGHQGLWRHELLTGWS